MDKQNEKNTFLNSKSLVKDKNNNFINWLKENMLNSITENLPIDPIGKASGGKEISVVTGSNYREPSNNINAYQQDFDASKNKKQDILNSLMGLAGASLSGKKEFYSKDSLVPEGFDADSIKINNVSKPGLFKRKINYTVTGKDNYKPIDPNQLEEQNKKQASDVRNALQKDFLPNSGAIPVQNQSNLTGGFDWNNANIGSNPSTVPSVNPVNKNVNSENYTNDGYINYTNKNKKLSEFIPPNLINAMYSEGGALGEPDPTLPPSPNANAKGRYLKEHYEQVTYPKQIVRYSPDNPDGTLVDSIPASADYSYTDSDGVTHTVKREYVDQGNVNSSAFLRNNVAVKFDGTIEDHKKMLKKANRSNWTGAHGFRGRNWKLGKTKEEIKKFKKDNPFFEKDRKRKIYYFLDGPNPNKSVYYEHDQKMADGGDLPNKTSTPPKTPIQTYKGSENYDDYLKWKKQNDLYLKNVIQHKKLVEGGFSDPIPTTHKEIKFQTGFTPEKGVSYVRYKSNGDVTPYGDNFFSDGNSGYIYVPKYSKPEIEYQVIENPEITKQKQADQEWEKANTSNNIIGYKKNFYSVPGSPGVQDYELIPIKKGNSLPTDGTYIDFKKLTDKDKYKIVGGAPTVKAYGGQVQKMDLGGPYFPEYGHSYMEKLNEGGPDLSQTATTHGSMGFTKKLNNFVAERTGTEKPQDPAMPGKDSNPYQNDDGVDTYTGEMTLHRKFDKNKARLVAEAGVGALNAIGNKKESNRKEAALRREFSDPFNYYGTHGEDRGDYMFNTPGAGPNFRPDQYVRSGFGTKNASLGLEVGDELSLSDSEIEKLKKQGYDIEYLD